MSVTVKTLLQTMSLRLKSAEMGISNPSKKLIDDARELVSELEMMDQEEFIDIEISEHGKAIYKRKINGEVLCEVGR